MSVRIFLTLHLLLLVLRDAKLQDGISNVTVTEFDSVVLKCNDSTALNAWKFAGSLLFHNRVPQDPELSPGMTVFQNNSLLVRNVTSAHEGIYECLISGKLKFKYRLQVQVIPNLQLTINGQPTDNLTYLEEGAVIEAVCLATRLQSAAKLTWFINDHSSYSYPCMRNKHIQEANGTLTRSMIRFIPQSFTGNITCIVHHGAGVTERRVDGEYFVYSKPTIKLVINGKDSHENVQIRETDYITASCRVEKAKAAMTITWLVNGEDVEIKSNITKHRSDLLHYNLTSTVVFKPSELRGNVTCNISDSEHSSSTVYWTVAVSFSYCSLTEEKKVTTETYITEWQAKNGFTFILKQPWMISLVGSFTVMTYITIIVQEPFANKPDGINITKSKSELPDVPKDSPYYYKYERQERLDGTYSTILDTENEGRIFYPKDMCLINNLNMGKFYNRWLGTISSPGTATCVVATTLSDDVLQRESINWYEYVRRVLDLPSSGGLVQVLGICVENDKLYLLHKHVFCATLDARLQTPSYAAMTTSEVTRCISSILDGMELIHSYGFLHPGLSTKKILLHSSGYCKLYDFCLSKDATNVVSEMRSSMSDEDLPPESVSRKEYDKYSDVWCVAIVLWKILSSGCSPFISNPNEVNGYGILVFEAPANLPESYKDLRNDELLKCLNVDIELRPKMKELRLSYEKIFKGTTPVRDMNANSVNDTYVPMKALT
ncbi:Tyrosine kinase receptor Cad96Ca [Apostichopus japonicus]|uniref:Tyrosine kinase receptor Cad96Ca n=1 Tax=Stichopus japonicus TaxID=307972 RepID=A0A2G8K4V3_STIJA|nr:Tyrosine kinase receptor Cad96Ca [Apostichopus japonicus]